MSQRIGITGAAGFFGWHLRCRLVTFGIDFVAADRTTFADVAKLDEFVSSVDVIVHLAGVNRSQDDAEIRDGNIGMADALVAAFSRNANWCDVIYANTVKAADPGPYGESKAGAAERLEAFANERGTRFADVLFPHLYGEFGRPHYNSGVTTFAHQLVRGEESTVNEGELELLHIQDACALIVELVESMPAGVSQHRPAGRKISVPDVYALMERLADYAVRGTIPEIHDDEFELRLFNTIRSQMWPDAYPFALTKHADRRGAFFEVVRAWGRGQTSISTTVPGVIRGEHYHFDKVERFAVISGEAMIRVRRLFTDEVVEFPVSGDEPCFIDMPPLCTHDITNTGTSELVTMFWSHDHFDPDKADTWPMPVVGEEVAA